jgi:NAD(P)-dependent dehydrogenase (short-subunit alcohol dehydrogenase family)
MIRRGRRSSRRGATLLAASVLGAASWTIAGKLRERDISGQVVLVTGGSRGLGFLLAREFGRQGCRVVICARDDAELARARADLESEGIETLAVTADVGDEQQVVRLIDRAIDRFHRVDILVNNAGVIQTGALPSMTLEDFREAMDVMYWGVVYPTLAVLPQMRARGSGQIVNITSIGGKLSVPHLLPYRGAKFAAVGLSEGLRAELQGSGVNVTTVVPGLMRTGSYLNAYFKGDQEREFSWFSLGSSLPFISMDAERAARRIVRATRRREAEPILSLPATIGARVHGMAPGPTADLLGLLGRRIMPGENTGPTGRARGMDVAEQVDSGMLDGLSSLGQQSAERFHEYLGPDPDVVETPST